VLCCAVLCCKGNDYQINATFVALLKAQRWGIQSSADQEAPGGRPACTPSAAIGLNTKIEMKLFIPSVVLASGASGAANFTRMMGGGGLMGMCGCDTWKCHHIAMVERPPIGRSVTP
jgi:hypothetical protein